MCWLRDRSRAAGITDGQERSVGTAHLTGGSANRREKRRKNKASGNDGIALEFQRRTRQRSKTTLLLWWTKCSWREKCQRKRSMSDHVPAQVNWPDYTGRLSAHYPVEYGLQNNGPIISYWLHPMMDELLHTRQFCGVPRRTIFKAIATYVRLFHKQRWCDCHCASFP